MWHIFNEHTHTSTSILITTLHISLYNPLYYIQYITYYSILIWRPTPIYTYIVLLNGISLFISSQCSVFKYVMINSQCHVYISFIYYCILSCHFYIILYCIFGFCFSYTVSLNDLAPDWKCSCNFLVSLNLNSLPQWPTRWSQRELRKRWATRKISQSTSASKKERKGEMWTEEYQETTISDNFLHQEDSFWST